MTAAEEAPEEENQRIVVTGSRIKRIDIEGANPVTIVSQEDILRSGMTNVGELLQRLPEVTGSPINTLVNNGGDGSVRIDIRGLRRTLVLINGRRIPDEGDFQTIPAAMIERIDILKDGASAIYGSDAIAGVVNIITRKDFTGMEISAQTSDYTNTDAGRLDQLSLVVGADLDKSHYLVGIDWSNQESILQGETPWWFFQDTFFIIDPDSFAENGPVLVTDDPVNFNMSAFGSSRIPQGNFTLNGNTAFAALAGCASVTTDRSADGSNAANYRCYNGSFLDPNNDSYNYSPINYWQTPYERTNLFFEANYEINLNHAFFSEMRINQRNSRQQLAPVPYDSQFDPGYQVSILDAGGNPVGSASGVSANNFYNPFGEDIIRARRRMAESARIFTQDVTQFQYIAGINGYLSDTWEYEISYNYGYRHRTDLDFGQYSGDRITNALGPSFFDPVTGQVVCGTPTTPIAGCISLNLFGDTGTVTQEMLDYIEVTLVDLYTTEQKIVNGFVSGDVFKLPGGDANLVFGYEHQTFKTDFEPDSGKETNSITGNAGAGVVGTISNTSLFSELYMPILDSLNISLGVRSDDYSSDADNVAGQLGIQFRPIDGLLIRGTFGDSFRAPSINELFSPQIEGFPGVQDPCNTSNYPGLTPAGQAACQSQGVPDGGYVQSDTQIRALFGGNPDLEPEVGESLTFGIAWSPDFIDGFKMTVDYWDISLNKVISTITASTILNNCVDFGTNCNRIRRFPGGMLEVVESVNENLGRREAKGYDWNLEYLLDTDFGSWSFDLLYSQLKNRTEYAFDGAPAWELSGTFDSIFVGGAYPEDKIKTTIDWEQNDFKVSYSVDYISAIHRNILFFGTGIPCTIPAEGVGGCFKVDSQIYQDLTFNYTIPDLDTRLTFGITNLTDEAPPIVTSDPRTYRSLGQGWFLRISHDL